MTMLMNHYSVHLILIASALNTYLVSGVAFISPVNSDDVFVYDHSDACYTTVLALMAALFYKKFLWSCARSDSTCWSKAHSFFGILGVISGKKPSSNLIKKKLCFAKSSSKDSRSGSRMSAFISRNILTDEVKFRFTSSVTRANRTYEVPSPHATNNLRQWAKFFISVKDVDYIGFLGPMSFSVSVK